MIYTKLQTNYSIYSVEIVWTLEKPFVRNMTFFYKNNVFLLFQGIFLILYY